MNLQQYFLNHFHSHRIGWLIGDGERQVVLRRMLVCCGVVAVEELEEAPWLDCLTALSLLYLVSK